MNRPPSRRAFLLAAAASALTGSRALAQKARRGRPDPTVDQLRRRLDELQSAREAKANETATPWETFEPRVDVGLPEGKAFVELESQAGLLSCVWTLRPVDPPGSPIRACMVMAGKETLPLAPGRYEVALRAGLAAGRSIELPAITATLKRGEGGASRFNHALEMSLRKRIEDEDKKAKQRPDDTTTVTQ